MPVNLSIKGVPDALAARLRERAAANHRSLQRELMAIIEVAATTPEAFDTDVDGISAGRQRPRAEKRLRPIEEIVEEWRKVLPNPAGEPSSTEIIRAMRDERYGLASEDASRKTRPR